jgi:hypothetical protein
MSKDPAVLFYTSDFITGTITMSDEQRGKYIILLCLQHQQGLLSYQDMINICKTYDEKIFKKFIKNNEGFYFNERMKIESDRRKKYSESRSKNRTNISKSYEKHMETENETITVNRNRKKKSFIAPTIDEVVAYFVENKYTKESGQKAYNYYSVANWRDSNGKPVLNWKQKMINVWFKPENEDTSKKMPA